MWLADLGISKHMSNRALLLLKNLPSPRLSVKSVTRELTSNIFLVTDLCANFKLQGPGEPRKVGRCVPGNLKPHSNQDHVTRELQRRKPSSYTMILSLFGLGFLSRYTDRKYKGSKGEYF